MCRGSVVIRRIPFLEHCSPLVQSDLVSIYFVQSYRSPNMQRTSPHVTAAHGAIK